MTRCLCQPAPSACKNLSQSSDESYEANTSGILLTLDIPCRRLQLFNVLFHFLSSQILKTSGRLFFEVPPNVFFFFLH